MRMRVHFPSLFRMMPSEESGVSRVLARLLSEAAAPLLSVSALEARVLFVGLGNREVTADAFGPLAAEGIHPTAMLPQEVRGKLGVPALSVFCPRVSSQTGIESTELLAAVARAVRPDLVLLADAMASRSAAHIGCTVELTDIGLRPGGGVGGGGPFLDKALFCAPVLTVGFPTVLDATDLAIGNAGDCVFDYLLPREADIATLRGATILAGAVEGAFGIPRLPLPF